ncbi:MAG: hypothetical protein IT291_03160 [Deltaproteobacteria bacterium]|nr:hypothetical protein [Deltaproteobacteria bacterium]
MKNIVEHGVREDAGASKLAEVRGNLSLEHILFIVAVAGLAGAVATFYTDIGAWFGGITLPEPPSF